MTVLRTLFTNWQEPHSRRILPVGRLDELDDAGGRAYRFCYVRGALEAQGLGFHPYLAFPDLRRSYLSRTLFPFFSNRVMPTTRPDYPAYTEALGLPTGPANPFDILERSNGRRETDRVEIIAAPVRAGASGNYGTYFLIRGIRYIDGAEERVACLRPSDRLDVIAEPGNQTNPRALRLRAARARPVDATASEAVPAGDVGYVPDYLTADLQQLAEQGVTPQIIVVRVNPPPVSVHHRVLCYLEAAWPEGFRPFQGERFSCLAEELRQDSGRADLSTSNAIG